MARASDFRELPEPVVLGNTVEGHPAAEPPGPEGERNADQHRALRDD